MEFMENIGAVCKIRGQEGHPYNLVFKKEVRKCIHSVLISSILKT
jgi:hypothetical protein